MANPAHAHFAPTCHPPLGHCARSPDRQHPVVELAELNEIIDVWDGDAILMAQALAKQLGLAVGISSGANFLGAAQLVEELDGAAAVITVFSDSNKKYLSTDLCRCEPVRGDYHAPRVDLSGFRAAR